MSQGTPPFNPYRGDSSPDAKTQRIPRDEMNSGTGSMPVSDSFRSGRHRTTSSLGRTGSLDQQRLLTWVDRGGWKYLAGLAVAVLVLLIVWLASNTGDTPGTPTVQPDSSLNPGTTNGLDQTIPGTIGTPGPAIEPTQPPVEQPATNRMTVVNTGTEGLFLRDAPGGTILATLPEGTIVEKIGEQVTDRVWFNIRDVNSGLEGWSASDYLVPAP